MGHKTKVGGTVYEITGGKAKVGGTVYNISGGKTKVEGTVRDISFGSTPTYTVKITGSSRASYLYVVVDGTKYTGSTTLEVPEGATVELYVKGYSSTSRKIIQTFGITRVNQTGIAWASWSITLDRNITVTKSYSTSTSQILVTET